METIRIALIIILAVAFIVIVFGRTKESLRWVQFGEGFGEKGEALLRDYDRLQAANVTCRVERGVPTSRIFRRFSRNLDDRVALFVLKEEASRAEQVLSKK
ncbi:hypothetical protein [Exiguobacterium flavidum]|uniref:hypothetical protein n=1 Tax=Exiguobacterium flavidum TaxID=2184695 RepID=UPI000DF76888|nr:hypothetical protein [Exiguobacterium flavidum]